MPVKEEKGRQFYIEFEDGEPIAVGRSIEMNDIFQEHYISKELPAELSFEIKIEGEGAGADDIIRGLKRTILCNNWRKMHHMPMIRKQKLTRG